MAINYPRASSRRCWESVSAPCGTGNRDAGRRKGRSHSAARRGKASRCRLGRCPRNGGVAGRASYHSDQHPLLPSGQDSKSDRATRRNWGRVRRLGRQMGIWGGSDHNELGSETETLLTLETNVTKKDAMSFERVVGLTLPIVALLISGLALWQSSEAQFRTTAPNVQIVSVRSTDRAYLQRRDQNGQDTDQYYSLAGSVKIKNYGD